MKELRDWLKDGDPVAIEPPLSEADVQRMRRAIADAGESHASSFSDWARGSWATATVVVALTIAVGMTRWFTPLPDVRNVDVGATSTSEPSQPAARRQVQLIAPGGTRVIWIFNADFQP
jgi:hypothetical protein